MTRAFVSGLIGLFAIFLGAGAGAERNVASEGEQCAGLVGTVCEPGLFCDLDAGHCGGMDIAGTCGKVPELCPEVYIPVCDCKGRTHSNDCHRQRVNAQKDHDGECKKGDAPAEG